MRNRNIQKIIRFNRNEALDLQKKAKKACMSESGLIRLLVKGYEPREKPDEKFFAVMGELSAIGNNINQLACHSLRHTFTTRMCEAGVNVKVIQDALGHKDITTTLNIYTDVTKELKMAEFEGLDQKFKFG